MVSLFAKATRHIGMTHIRHLTPITQTAATGLAARVYHDIEQDFGMLAPPLTLHAAAPTTLAATWLMLRETLIVPGQASRQTKEAIAAAVSLANRCPYCVDVHATTLAGLLRGPDAHKIAADRIHTITNPHLRALAQWARTTNQPPTTNPPFTPAQAPEIIGVAVTFHYINRMVNIFLRDSPLPPIPPTGLRIARYAATHILRRLANLTPQPGQSLDLLPDAPLPTDLTWAKPQPHIAAAFARATAAIDTAATHSIPPQIRELVHTQLATTTPPPDQPNTAWLNPAIAPLPPPQHPTARIALLTALRSHQIPQQLINQYLHHHNDTTLIQLTSWASLTAARRIGQQLQPTTH